MMRKDNATASEVAEWWYGFGTGLLYGGACVLIADGTASRDGAIAVVMFVLGGGSRMLSGWIMRRKVEVSGER